jgi:serine protease Do
MVLPSSSIARHRARLAALAGGVALSLLVAPVLAAETAAPPATLDRSVAAESAAVTSLPSFGPLVKKVMPAVVNISVTMKDGQGLEQKSSDEDDQDQAAPDDQQQGGPDLQSPFDQFLRRFFQQQGRGGLGQGPGFGQMTPQPHAERMALGSGFIIDPSGYVVTNNHVVENANTVTVIFQDGSKHKAKIVGRDAKTDLALVKIDAPQPLPYVQWGDSTAEQVGDWVLAVGNPFGLGGTVSSGIISARGRDIHEGPYDDFLQIDASINRGNSGGPTFSLDGKVIGINTAIYSPNGGSVGIGFAIPSSLAQPVIQQLKDHGKVDRGWLGVQIQEVTPEIAKNLGLPKTEGAIVADVTAGGPAEKAGLKQGDVILAYDGHDIGKLRDLPLAVAETPVGQKAPVKLWRDGHEQTLDATIAAMPAQSEQMAANGGGPAAKTAMGLSLAPLTPELRRELHVGKDVKGVVVTGVAAGSPLAQLGVTRGDVIEGINRQAVTSPEDATQKLDAAGKQKDADVLLLINRHGINQYIAMTLEQNGGNG